MLGATGSIGRQALDIIYNHPDKYKSVVLAAGRRVDDLIELARVHRPALAKPSPLSELQLLPELRLLPTAWICRRSIWCLPLL